MRVTQGLIYFAFLSLVGVLLLFPGQSIKAGQQGLLLWFNIIIPTLFPFMILSTILLNSPIIDPLGNFFSPLFKRIFGISGVASYALIMGLFSGYPMGAFITTELYSSHKISRSEASYLLTFCNNASPMFVLGFISTSLLSDVHNGPYLLLAIYLGDLLTALIIKYFRPREQPSKAITLPKKAAQINFSYIDSCILKTSEVLVKVGGYMILFSIPIVFLSQIPVSSIGIKFLVSTLELSNGANLLATLTCPLTIKYALICTLCAFGSFCVVGQTSSIIKASGLSLRNYFYAKVLNAACTFIISLTLFNWLLPY